jgi:hypothetical protein
MSRYIPHNDPYTNLNYDERLKKSIRHLNRLKKLRRLLGLPEKNMYISPGFYVQEHD